MARLLSIAAGGAIGSVLRYLVSGWVQESRALAAVRHLGVGAAFPWGTLAVNLTGCFAIGLLAGVFQDKVLLHPAWRSFLLLGVLGGYTTFSAFGLETLHLLQEGSFALAWMNGLGSPVLGVLGVFLGDAAARVI